LVFKYGGGMALCHLDVMANYNPEEVDLGV
jgi:hypothetical protein